MKESPEDEANLLFTLNLDMLERMGGKMEEN